MMTDGQLQDLLAKHLANIDKIVSRNIDRLRDDLDEMSVYTHQHGGYAEVDPSVNSMHTEDGRWVFEDELGVIPNDDDIKRMISRLARYVYSTGYDIATGGDIATGYVTISTYEASEIMKVLAAYRCLKERAEKAGLR